VEPVDRRNIWHKQQVTGVAAYHKTMRLAETGVALAIVVSAVSLLSPLDAACQAGTPVYGYRIVHVYPHDPSAFTQGLEYRGGFLYEGTGLNGRSGLRKVDLQ